MEIIHLILGKANPERMNGVNKVVYQLATEQVLAGKNVSVWGVTNNTEHDYGERKFVTKLFQAHKNPFKIDPILQKSLLENKEQRVIHLHGGWIPFYASISKFLFKNKIPFVITPHGAYNTIAMQRSKWTKKIYFALFEKKLLDRASKIHSIGESEMQGLQSFYPNKKSFLLPYGFTAPKFESKTGNKKESFTIGFVGRLDIYTKGLDLLIEAFENFIKLAPSAKLWIIGDSKERIVLENTIQSKKLSNNIQLWGSKFGIEKDDLILQMDIFVHPSRNEGLPASVLEASSMGIPCIVSLATNVASYITQYNAGIAIANENITELTNALILLHKKWEEGNLESIKNNAQKMVREAFNWQHIVNEFDRLYTI